MSRKSLLPQSRRHIWTYDEDWAYLERAFGPNSANRMGVGPAIRNIVHIYVKNLRAQETKRLEAPQAREKEDA